MAKQTSLPLGNSIKKTTREDTIRETIEKTVKDNQVKEILLKEESISRLSKAISNAMINSLPEPIDPTKKNPQPVLLVTKDGKPYSAEQRYTNMVISSVVNILGEGINPSTAELQSSIVTAINNISSPTGYSLKAKQDDMIVAIEAIVPATEKTDYEKIQAAPDVEQQP